MYIYPDRPLSKELAALQLRWTIGAFKFAPVHLPYVNAVHGIGRLDVALRVVAPEVFSVLRTSAVSDSAEFLIDYECLSNLWVMGGYEFVRSLSQRLGRGTAQGEAVRDVKLRFERVRMPLAKFEAAARFRATDKETPDRISRTDVGAGWIVNPSTAIYRVDLADALVAMFDLFADTDDTRAIRASS